MCYQQIVHGALVAGEPRAHGDIPVFVLSPRARGSADSMPRASPVQLRRAPESYGRSYGWPLAHAFALVHVLVDVCLARTTLTVPCARPFSSRALLVVQIGTCRIRFRYLSPLTSFPVLGFALPLRGQGKARRAVGCGLHGARVGCAA